MEETLGWSLGTDRLAPSAFFTQWQKMSQIRKISSYNTSTLHAYKKLIYFQCSHHNAKMKWNESGFRPPLCTYRLNWAGRTSWGWWPGGWLRWHCPPDTGFEIRALAVWGRARYHNTDFHTWMGKKNIFCFFQTAETANLGPPPSS